MLSRFRSTTLPIDKLLRKYLLLQHEREIRESTKFYPELHRQTEIKH